MSSLQETHRSSLGSRPKGLQRCPGRRQPLPRVWRAPTQGVTRPKILTRAGFKRSQKVEGVPFLTLPSCHAWRVMEDLPGIKGPFKKVHKQNFRRVKSSSCVRKAFQWASSNFLLFIKLFGNLLVSCVHCNHALHNY